MISMGPEALVSVDLPRAARFLGDALGVPSDLIRKELSASPVIPPVTEEELENVI